MKIDAKCPKCQHPDITITKRNGLEYSGYCAKCNSPVFGTILLKTERHKGYEIVLFLTGDERFSVRLMKIGGGVDWNPPMEADTQEEAIKKAREYIDTVPEMDWT